MTAPWTAPLRRGPGGAPEHGACLMEAVAWIATGEMTDDPPCVCPVVRAYAIHLNDVLPHAPRQRLRAYLPLLPGTSDPEAMAARIEALALHVCRAMLGPFLRGTGFEATAEAIVAAPDAHRAIEAARAGRCDWPMVLWLDTALLLRREHPTEAANWCAQAMAQLLEDTGHAPAIAGLDAMLAVGRRAEPPDVEHVAAAIATFAAAQRRPGFDREVFARARLAVVAGAAA